MKSDDVAEGVLTQLGFRVERIPVAKEVGRKRPDFLISYGRSSAIVEAKLKGDDPVKVSEREEALSTVGLHGVDQEMACSEPWIKEALSKVGYHSTDHSMGRDETISGVVANAARQLRMETTVAHDYKIVLIIADCINSAVVMEVVIDTLLGRTSVIDVENGMTEKPCYFYRNSDFFRRKDIDAAIVGHISPSSGSINVKICLNPYSSRYIDLAESDLLQPFKDAKIDPIEEERLGHGYIPDTDVERKEHRLTSMFSMYDPVMHHLQKKYHTGRLVRADFQVPLITIRSIDEPAAE